MELFVEISVILVFVAILAIVLEKLRLPAILGYILAGLFVGPAVLNLVHSVELLESFSHFGVIILLFIVGIHLSPEVLKDLGWRVLLLGCLQVTLSMLMGLLVFFLLDFTLVQAALLSLTFAFSSTILVLKLLGDARQLDTLHGRIAIGILIIQDIVVSIALVFLGTTADSISLSFGAAQQLITIVGLISLILLIQRYVFPKLLPLVARNQETLFLTSLAWGFGIAALFSFVGLNLEIGALFAGVLLSTSEFAEEVSARLKPLRDFFVMLFFVQLGSSIALSSLSALIIPSLLLVLLVSILKPLVIIFLMQRFGYHRKPSFKTGVSLGQLSEFSFILVALWLSNGWLPPSALTLTTLVGIITIALSTLSIPQLGWLENRLLPLIPNLRSTGKRSSKSAAQFEAFLFGYNRVGESLYSALKKRDLKTLVIDFDPKQVEELEQKHIKHRYGDAGDAEFLQSLPTNKLKVVISSLPSVETNLILCKFFTSLPISPTILCFAGTSHEAEKLYDAGASFVVIPHAQAALTLSSLLERFGHDKRKYTRLALNQ